MVSLRNFNLIPFRANNKRSQEVVYRLNRDASVIRNMTWRFEEKFAKEPEQEENFELGKAYLVEHEKELIGMTGASLLNERTGVTDVWLALFPEYRKKNLGPKVLSDLTLHLINNIDGLQNVSLSIRKDNYPARKSCEKEGFVLVDTNGVNSTYMYFEEKNKKK